jgi:hypothetical protein
MTRSNPGINIETPNTRDPTNSLGKILNVDPYFDLRKLDNSILTGWIVRGYFVRGLRAISHIVARFIKVFGKESEISF